MDFIDSFLNRTTMYRLVLYYLIVMLVAAGVLGYFNLLPYNPWSIAFSALFLVAVSLIVNALFSRVFRAPTNAESVYITALILALIVTPIQQYSDLVWLAWVAILAMSSKYILAIGSKHVFNPVAIAVVLTSIGFNQSASWWVGNLPLMPVVVVGGLLVARKIRREDMLFYFFLSALLTMSAFTFLSGHSLPTALADAVLHSSLFFFAFVMLTEPLTTPPVKSLQIAYAVIVGVLFAPQFHVGGFYTTPEIALVMGNIFSYLVSPKQKLILHLTDKILIAPDTYDFVFKLSRPINYRPGQYMEWTLPHNQIDDRGNRRYFTLASSPTEDNLRLGIKFNHPGSSFKEAMLKMDPHTPVVGAQLSGDFTLPRDKSQKLVFVAGGIGITPFRSMLKFLIDKGERRDIVLLYSNRTADEIVYRDVFDAAQSLGIKIIYTLTDTAQIPAGWTGQTGRIGSEMINKLIPDYNRRIFYLSGPHTLVTGFTRTLSDLGIPQRQIITDFFPGFV